MANPDHSILSGGTTQSAANINAGLRAHMNRVYGLMGTGLIVTALVAFLVGTVPALQAIFLQGGLLIRLAVAFAPLGLILFMSFRFEKMSTQALTMSFYAVAALIGISFGGIAMLASANGQFAILVGQALGITSVAFLALSLWGYTTKRDISGWGSFLFIGLIGIVLASIVNIFLQSSMMSFIISSAGVLIFAGLTAYDTQAIKNQYLGAAQHGAEGMAFLGKAAVMGALGLYLNFVNMFQMILNLLMMFSGEE